MRVVLAVAQAGILAAAAQAGQVEDVLSLGAPAAGAAPAVKATPECSGGIVVDDGSFENAYRPAAGATAAALVMRVTPPADSSQDLDRVCLCWTRFGAGDTAIDHDVVIYDDSGPEGGPGALWDRVPASAFDLPEYPATAFYQYDLAALGVTVPPGSFYLGVGGWDRTLEGDVFLCADEDGPGGEPAYASVNGSDWVLFDAESDYRALGVRAELLAGPTLSSSAGLIVPGFEVDVVDPTGPTVQFAVRNTTDAALDVEIEYHGRRLEEEPLRTDALTLAPQATAATDVRFDLTGLAVENGDGVASGLAIVTQAGGTTAPDLEGDYFRIDAAADFATGNRLVRPADLCDVRETRVVDFGSGSQLRILLDRPRGISAPSFIFTAYDFAGAMIATDEVFTSDHFTVIDAVDLGIAAPFGTIVFDFTSSSGGWVSARYSAFGRFSAEIESACRDAGVLAAARGAVTGRRRAGSAAPR